MGSGVTRKDRGAFGNKTSLKMGQVSGLENGQSDNHFTGTLILSIDYADHSVITPQGVSTIL
jgi:hypothetical protein